MKPEMHNNIEDRKWWTLLAAVALTMFMDGVDISVVGMALPKISAEFGVDAGTVSWTAVIYSMILGGLLVCFARTVADTGVRRIMTLGLVLFAVGSILCFLTPLLGAAAFGVLVIARIVEAVGAAMKDAAAPACITKHMPRSKLALGMAVMSVGAALGFIIGPVIGGVVLASLPWEYVFLLNPPIAIFTAVMVFKAVGKESEKSAPRNRDIRGAVTLFLSLVLGIFALEEWVDESIRPFTVMAGIGCVILLIGFIFAEKSATNPLIRLDTFRLPGFGLIFLCIMLSNAAYMGVFYLGPFYLGKVLETSDYTMGLLLTVSAVSTALTVVFISRASDRFGRRWACAGAGIANAAGYGIMAVLADSMTATMFILPMVLVGIGWSCVSGPMATSMVEHAGGDRDMASSLVNEAIHVGGAIGTALVAMVFMLSSGTMGIDAGELTSSQILDGFVPSMVVLAGISLFVFLAMAYVKDAKTEEV